MHSSHRTSGFSIIEGVIIVVFVGIIAALGLTFYNVATNKSASDTTASSAESIKATPVPDINSTDDLDTVTSDLDTLDTADSEDATLLEEQDAAF